MSILPPRPRKSRFDQRVDAEVLRRMQKILERVVEYDAIAKLASEIDTTQGSFPVPWEQITEVIERLKKTLAPKEPIPWNAEDFCAVCGHARLDHCGDPPMSCTGRDGKCGCGMFEPGAEKA